MPMSAKAEASPPPASAPADPIYQVIYPPTRTKTRFLALGLVLGLVVAGGGFLAFGSALAPAPAATPSETAGPSHVVLTIAINPITGWPQYTPANFSVGKGEVTITIVDDDVPMAFPGCQCNVSGTLGGVELINGTPTALVSNTNVAHTFDVPSLGINVLSPAETVVTFSAYFNETGSFTWMCVAPCGGASPTAPPMGVPGYMTGTITVV